MKKRLLTFIFSTFLLTGCSSNFNGLVSKEVSNDDFSKTGNLILPDFPIDGILEPEYYENPSLTVNLGGRNDFETKVEAKLVFGEKGLTIGFNCYDKYLAASTNYNDAHFVVNSDNVEFYIDTKNDKGIDAQNDDFAFLVNPEEFIEMRNGTGSYWSSWSGVVDYGVHVEGTINNDSDIDIGWSCEVYLPYQTFGFTKDSIVGVAFGCRDKKTFEVTSKWTGWIADPQIINTYASINKNGPVDFNVEELSINCGHFSYNEGVYSSTVNTSIGTFNSHKISEGTFSTDVYIPYDKDSDNGVIFQVYDPIERKYYFEDEYVSYYFFFINKDGNAMLGYVDQGVWNEIGVYENLDYAKQDWNNFRVILHDEFITCYINDTCTFVYNDDRLLELGCGFRCAMKNVKYKNVNFSSSIEGAKTGIRGYQAARGEFKYTDDTETKIEVSSIKDAGAILYCRQDIQVTENTLSSTIKTNSYSDNGIIFHLNNKKRQFWESEEGTSYYFFMINHEGYAYLGAVNSSWETCWKEISSVKLGNYSLENEYNLKVVYSDTRIRCYVNDEPLIGTNEVLFTGKKYGYRAGSINTTFTVFKG